MGTPSERRANVSKPMSRPMLLLFEGKCVGSNSTEKQAYQHPASRRMVSVFTWPTSYISLLRIHRIDLAPTTTRQFCFYFFHQAPLLRVDLVLAQIWRLRNEESFPPLRLQVVFPPKEIPETKRPIWIKQHEYRQLTTRCGVHTIRPRFISETDRSPIPTLRVTSPSFGPTGGELHD